MDLTALQKRAVEIAALYDRSHVAKGRRPWDPDEVMMGFVGDVGDLAKLVMAVEGRRDIPEARERLGHELADCLWSVLVLAQRYGVDLEDEFARMTTGIEQHLAEEQTSEDPDG